MKKYETTLQTRGSVKKGGVASGAVAEVTLQPMERPWWRAVPLHTTVYHAGTDHASACGGALAVGGGSGQKESVACGEPT